MNGFRFLPVSRAWTRRVALGLLGTLACASLAVAQSAQTSVIIVGVSDAETGEALSGTQIILPGLSKTLQTDGLGEARFASIPSGLHRIRVRRLGYAAVDTSLTFVGDTTGVVFRIHRTPVSLETVDVKAVSPRLMAFEMRRAIGTGRYLTAEQLEKDGSRPFGLVAMMRFPGLRMVTDADGRPHIASVRGSCGVGVSPSEGILAGARGGGGGGRGAATTGGSPTGVEGSGGAGSGTSGGSGSGAGSGATRTSVGSCMPAKECYVVTFLDNLQLDSADFDLITTWDIAGVEYYSGNSVPARYRVSGAACGVLLVWSK
jgi:hypothetical protein